MATVVKELLELSRDTLIRESGKYRASRVFLVYDDATPANFDAESDVIAIFGTSNLPTYQDGYPGIATLIATTPEIRRVPGTIYQWHVIWGYEQITFPSSGLQPNEVGYAELNLDISRRFFPGFRTANEANTQWLVSPASVHAAGSQTNTDIGGRPIDGGGKEGSVLRLQTVMRFTEVMTGTSLASSLATYHGYTGNRNSATFYGASAGQVLMGPVRTQRIALNLFNVHFEFIWDNWYHLQQQAMHDGSGEIVLSNAATMGGMSNNYKGKAYPVLWVQPFGGLKDFTSISSNW